MLGLQKYPRREFVQPPEYLEPQLSQEVRPIVMGLGGWKKQERNSTKRIMSKYAPKEFIDRESLLRMFSIIIWRIEKLRMNFIL